MKKYLLERFREPSTWRGLILIATALGMQISTELAVAIASFGMALAGGAGVFTRDNLTVQIVSTDGDIIQAIEKVKHEDLADLVRRHSEH